MSRVSSLIKRLDNALQKLQLSDKPVYKRVSTRTGGDSLIGRPASVSTVDTLVSPTPYVRYMTNSDRMLFGDAALQIGDLICTMSPSSLTSEELENGNLSIVLKDATSTHEYSIVGQFPQILQGTVVVFDIVLRSKKR